MADMSLPPWQTLDGKVVMVTGASAGIGREFCLDLAKAGCKIVAAARRTDKLKSLCEEINLLNPSSASSSSDGSVGGSAFTVALDVTADGPVIDDAVQKAWDAFGRIDVLVSNAGVRGLNRGHLPGGVAYAASKTGLNAMTKVMALELGVYNIRVNSISPGLFKSEIIEGLMQKDWLNTIAERTVPLRTWGTSDPALTSLVRYLIHDSSSYVTGNILVVDAGASLPGVPIFSSL
ncbi:3-oxoacyl-[acyl-carrier-protein] reductase, chloroplastic-like isoform X3 [Aristolochia californica]|uniref:3-oxoacyl-[acyl-carrier-protein] reductase, chloroplastic-like isoform X3 n=1 Tax=Aristolochia californica TaxID=171875 RepID=UPI0035DA38FD